MYGLVVKTSVWVWRLSFMTPHFRIGRHILFLPWSSVCLSIRKSRPLCNLKTVHDILMELHRIMTLGYIVWNYSRFELCKYICTCISFCDKIVPRSVTLKLHDTSYMYKY